MKQRATLLTTVWVVALLISVLLAACGSTPATSSTQQPVTLKLFHWNKSDYGPQVEQINALFHKENPTITVQYESIPTDQYETVLKARLASGDAPDVFGAHDIRPYAKAGYLLDLSSQPWAADLTSAAKSTETYNGKLFGLPVDQHVIGVVYNKKIFADLGLSVPQTWDQFLQLSQKIKDSNITPLALGIKDQWVTQLIPYSMSGTALYHSSPQFDQDLRLGKASFSNSAWAKMMQDYLDLNKRGFFNKGPLGTTYDQSVQLMALGRAAMVINGDWIVPAIKKANPSIDLGMFELPYVEQVGQPIWVPSSVGAPFTVSVHTKHQAEALKYLQFWARPDIASIYLKAAGDFSALTTVSTKLDPTVQDMLPYIKQGTSTFPDQGYAPGVQDVMLKDTQGLFAGSITVPAMLQEMDKTFQENKAQII